MRVAAVQLHAGASKADNVERALRLIDEAASGGAELIVLPEWTTYVGPAAGYSDVAEPLPGPTSRLVAAKAREHGVVIHGGSLIERLPDDGAAGPRFCNSSYVADAAGEIRAVYRKVHLFDVAVGDDLSESESSSTVPGDQLVAVELPGFTLGMSICYDLRFPELYRALALAQATVMAVPSAFAETTGRAHWEVLLRARAVENGAFVVAPAQHGPGAAWPMFGHSMIVDPWGVVLAELAAGDGVVVADIDLAEAQRRRAQLPVLRDRRPAVYARPILKARLAFS
jgi:predicted amidohydrolase